MHYNGDAVAEPIDVKFGKYKYYVYFITKTNLINVTVVAYVEPTTQWKPFNFYPEIHYLDNVTPNKL